MIRYACCRETINEAVRKLWPLEPPIRLGCTCGNLIKLDWFIKQVPLERIEQADELLREWSRQYGGMARAGLINAALAQKTDTYLEGNKA